MTSERLRMFDFEIPFGPVIWDCKETMIESSDYASVCVVAYKLLNVHGETRSYRVDSTIQWDQ